MKTPFALSKKSEKPSVDPETGEELPEPEGNETGEQTRFAEELPMIFEGDSSEAGQATGSRRKFITIAAVSVPIILLVLMLILVNSARRGTAIPSPTPTPSGDTNQAQKGEIERRLDLVDQDVAKSDPVQPELAFPPVNFELNLEDATLRQRRLGPRR